MSLIRWNPSHELWTFPTEVLNMQREVNRMFNSFFPGGVQEESELISSRWLPAVDIVGQEDEYLVKVELPGVNKDDVKITVQDNILTIRGEKKQENETRKSNYHRVERSYGSFQRSFTVPAPVQGDKIDAAFKDGILSIRLPKAEEAKRKQIDVKVK
jgi:HSP20 family protein